MLMLSCSMTLICVMVTVACVASVCRDSPRTLALDRNWESHSALSPEARGGISDGGAAGSNMRLAKATGCLSMIGKGVGTGASPSGRRDEKPRHASQPRISTPSKTQNAIKPREGNTASAFHFAKKTERETGVYRWRMTRKVLSSSGRGERGAVDPGKSGSKNRVTR